MIVLVIISQDKDVIVLNPTCIFIDSNFKKDVYKIKCDYESEMYCELGTYPLERCRQLMGIIIDYILEDKKVFVMPDT